MGEHADRWGVRTGSIARFRAVARLAAEKEGDAEVTDKASEAEEEKAIFGLALASAFAPPFLSAPRRPSPPTRSSPSAPTFDIALKTRSSRFPPRD